VTAEAAAMYSSGYLLCVTDQIGPSTERGRIYLPTGEGEGERVASGARSDPETMPRPDQTKTRPGLVLWYREFVLLTRYGIFEEEKKMNTLVGRRGLSDCLV